VISATGGLSKEKGYFRTPTPMSAGSSTRSPVSTSPTDASTGGRK
jgi:hypothetical protein